MEKEALFVSDITKQSNVERKFQCTSCDKRCKYQSELKVHVKRIHLKIKDHFCDNCDKSFSSKSDLNDHLSTHFGKKFPCYMCGVKLSRKINLINHMKSLHVEKLKIEEPKSNNQQPTPEKLPCHICGKLFNSNKTLRRHVRKNHVGKTEKAQRFSNSFKEEVLEKVKEIGVVAARKAFGIHESTIKG